MNRSVGLVNLLQAVVFALAAGWLGARWTPAAVVATLCAACQLVAAVAVLTQRPARLVRGLSGLTLLGVATLAALFLHAATHLITRFGPEAAQTGQTAIGVIVLALPWFLFFPLWQAIATRPSKEGVGGTIGLMLLPLLTLPAHQLLTNAPDETWSTNHEATEGAGYAWATWQQQPVQPPTGSDPATVLLTPWRSGVSGKTVRGDGETFAAAIKAAVERLPAPTADTSLVIDVAQRRWEAGLVPVGSGGRLTADGGSSPATSWRPDAVSRIKLTPLWRVTQPSAAEGDPTQFSSAIANNSGARPLTGGWSSATALSADTALQAAVAGARHILANQSADGRFTYKVKGPSGTPGKGYNFPRHAGTAWYLARVAERTNDDTIREGAQRALDWLKKYNQPAGDDASFVADPRRKDGLAWIGTTALATLAASSLGDEIAGSWGRMLARAVDPRGQVRGEFSAASGQFDEQVQNPYGQGQTLLALATLVRNGHEELRAATQRAAQFVNGAYAPLGAVRLVGLDEHWSCLAALALKEAGEPPSGMSLCTAYLASTRAPRVAQGHWASAGPAGGRAEAVVAAAVLSPESAYKSDALRYGELFLASAYQWSDAPFLSRAANLLGGFRDRPWELDVRIDSVQHIGCALLGIEALLRAETHPGSLP